QSRPENTHVAILSKVRFILRTSPWEFSFFQAMRLLQRMMPERALIGRFNPPSREVARLKAHPSVTFPASQIQDLQWPDDGVGVALTVNFMGLFGPLGSLPLYYSQYIVQRVRAKDYGMAAFLDMFNHRMIALFYRAWEKYRFYVAYERGERD